MEVQPYLFFEGRCEEAIEFYKKALGAQVEMLMRFKDMPSPPEGAKDNCPEAAAEGAPPPDKVMHASVHIGKTRVLMSDGHCQGAANFQGFGLALAADDDDEVKRLFDALGDGGEVRMELGKTFFASSFGMVSDRFGVMWMIIAADHG